MTMVASCEIEKFGIMPKAALLPNPDFGSAPSSSAQHIAAARKLIAERAPTLEIDGEIHGEYMETRRCRKCSARPRPGTILSHEANLLIMSNVEAATIAYNLLKIIGGEGMAIAPFLLTAAKQVHILTPAAAARRIHVAGRDQPRVNAECGWMGPAAKVANPLNRR
jgi:malate dehydrogenase (oxaloacetate-decarboxylating)(NADP+)